MDSDKTNSKARSLFHFPKKRNGVKKLRVPDEEMHVYRSVVHRLDSNRDWKKRLLILTKEEMVIALPGHDFIIENIPLVKDLT